MLLTVHDAPGFKLDIRVTSDPYVGPTVEFYSTWPKANHPDPHRLLSLTLPRESLRTLADVLARAADDAEQKAHCRTGDCR